MDGEIRYVFLYIAAFGISGLVLENFGIKSLQHKIIYFVIMFLIYKYWVKLNQELLGLFKI